VAVLGHRGGRGPEPENSLGAFRRALASGAAGVELDVRRTADGVAVVHHDPTLADGRVIAATSAAALPEEVPTLAAALATCAGAAVDVEVKSSPLEPGHDPAEALAREVAGLVASVAGHPGGPAAVLVSSFWPSTVAAVRAAEPGVPTGLLVHPALEVRAGLDQAAALGCTTLLPFRDQLDLALAEAAHILGIAVVVWTVNDRAGLVAAADAGADAVVTDEVELAVEVLGVR
jgi:glycerophosphoryl diester phosphodiesterase